MLINKQGYYFLKVILFFAFSEKKLLSVREMSARVGVSVKVLEQVLLALKNAGILDSKRGPNGGYTLNVDVSKMSVLDIFNISEKKLGIIPLDNNNKMQIIDNVINLFQKGLERDIIIKLQGIQVKDLINNMKEMVGEKGLNYSI